MTQGQQAAGTPGAPSSGATPPVSQEDLPVSKNADKRAAAKAEKQSKKADKVCKQ